MRHSTCGWLGSVVLLGIALVPEAVAQDANYLPGCNQREYVYAGGRLLALVDSSPGITLGFETPAAASVPESGVVNLA